MQGIQEDTLALCVLGAPDNQPQGGLEQPFIIIPNRAALVTGLLCECSYFLRLSASNLELFYWTLC